jgi:hypothetical protein
VHGEEPGGRLRETLCAEDLRADVAVQSGEAQALLGADGCDQARRILQDDAEFLVLVRGREEFVGVCVDAAVHPQAYGLHDAVPRGGGGDAVDFDRAVDHDRADAHPGGLVDFGQGLGVAVETEPGRVDAGGERHGQFSAGADVDVESVGHHPAGDLGGQEGLARVVDAHGSADAGELGFEGRAQFGRAGARIRLVDDVERSAELGGEGRRADSADDELAVGVARCRDWPETVGECVGVSGQAEPLGGKWIDGHG